MKRTGLVRIISLSLVILISSCSKDEIDPFSLDFGVFTDQRDQREYKWVKIGQLNWMADNLAYDAGNRSMLYDEDIANETKYGRLYTWINALSVCPAGWHLPSDQEWDLLALYISVKKGPFDKGGDDWFGVGEHLKALTGWGAGYNGTDDFGFSGLPGGLFYDDKFGYIEQFGGWWSATEKSSTHAWVRGMLNVEPDFYRYDYPKENGFSVRCVQD